jgi:anti-anti-sigma factor
LSLKISPAPSLDNESFASADRWLSRLCLISKPRVRADNSRVLIIDFTNVPYADSAGIGALVGAYVTHQKDGRSLALVGVSDRIHNALQVTRVDHFFRFFNTVAEAAT